MNIKERESQIKHLKLKMQELELKEINEAVDFSTEITKMRKKIKVLEENIMKCLTPWDRVIIAREQKRPTSLEYIDKIFEIFIEFHGDRLFSDDKAIIGGIASFNGMPVTVIGDQKGYNTKDNIYRNFGMPSPEGYRKALRLMKQSEKFNRPIITFVDTPGAFCGISAEERGQGEAIARNLYEMSALKVPIITIFIGEGGSGGALAIAVSDKIYALENSIYSILSPEGFASILWKDSTRAEDAAGVMKITATDLKELDIIEDIITEPLGGAHKGIEVVVEGIKNILKKELLNLKKLPKDVLLDNRYKRFRKFGDYKKQ